MTIATSYLLLLALGVALAIPIINSMTDTGVDRLEPGLRLRLIAAGWFALAACVPVGGFGLALWLMRRQGTLEKRRTHARHRLVIQWPPDIGSCAVWFLAWCADSGSAGPENIFSGRAARIHGWCVFLLAVIKVATRFAKTERCILRAFPPM